MSSSFVGIAMTMYQPSRKTMLLHGIIHGAAWVVAMSALAREPDFNFDIRPILSDRCYHCHGPDESSREADLRLDTREGLFRLAEYGEGASIVQPGDPQESALYLRIASDDEYVRMPPPGSHRDVSTQEQALIRRWIEKGAVWKDHWAFLPPREMPVRDIRGDHSIDAFVRARLQEQSLPAAARASRQRLIRRVTMDLTGLPPTVADVEAFVADSTPGAYENLVDRLLAQDEFGERMAVEWLDVARYADTYGYQNDRHRDVWRWRDWVIQAFNQNLPFDEFIVWQLAGDLLPEATTTQTLATTFNRLHRQTNEGGSIDEEFRSEYVMDRVDTFGTAFLGLTIGCARCHDHKYDPISTKEYYQLFAFFDNIDESGTYSHFTDAVPTPTLMLPTIEQRRQQAALRARVADATEAVASLAIRRRPAFDKWLTKARPESVFGGCVGSFSCDAMEDGKLVNDANAASPAVIKGSVQLTPGVNGKALSLNGENGFASDAGGNWDRDQPFSIAAWIKIPSDLGERAVIWHRSQAWTDAGSRGYQLLCENGRLTAALVHFLPGNAVVVATETMPSDEWLHVTVVYDGSSTAAGLQIYINAERAAQTVLRDTLAKTIKYDANAQQGGASSPVQLTVGSRFRDRGFQGGVIDELRIFERRLTALEVRQLVDPTTFDRAWPDRNEELYETYLHGHDREYAAALDTLQQLRQELYSSLDATEEIMAMREMVPPRVTRLLQRGSYASPGEVVQRDTPGVMPAMPGGLPRNRLGLAKWLTLENHPLTARVAVNRFWQMLFGRGLVATPDNFGSQGELPSHPDLLNWLARSFIKSGWDTKELLKQIVMSETYQQDSDCSPELRTKDPDNIWLARGPRYRWPAELLRDQALHASGLLVNTQGGPPVKPYQPAGLWKEVGPDRFVRDEGDGSHRRSIYTYWKRTAPPPAMLTLDAPTREVCVVKRPATSTPLQALALLNDPQYVEAARALAEQGWKSSHGDPRRAIRWIFQTLTSRPPLSKELFLLESGYREQLEAFREDGAAVEALLSIGDRPPNATCDPAQLAGLTSVTQVIMNFDEVVMKR